MNTNDAIVLHIIQRDMKRKGVEDYELLDEVVANPTFIEVSVNEAVYVVYFSTVFTRSTFEITLTSLTDTVKYSELNTRTHLSFAGNQDAYPPEFKTLIESGMTNFESSQITKHYGNVKVNNPNNKGDFYFFLRYIRVKF